MEFASRHNLERMAERFLADPTVDLVRLLDSAAALLGALPFGVDLWKIQNVYYRLRENIYPDMRRLKQRGDRTADAWMDCFEALGQKLNVKVD